MLSLQPQGCNLICFTNRLKGVWVKNLQCWAAELCWEFVGLVVVWQGHQWRPWSHVATTATISLYAQHHISCQGAGIKQHHILLPWICLLACSHMFKGQTQQHALQCSVFLLKPAPAGEVIWPDKCPTSSAYILRFVNWLSAHWYARLSVTSAES